MSHNSPLIANDCPPCSTYEQSGPLEYSSTYSTTTLFNPHYITDDAPSYPAILPPIPYSTAPPYESKPYLAHPNTTYQLDCRNNHLSRLQYVVPDNGTTSHIMPRNDVALPLFASSAPPEIHNELTASDWVDDLFSDPYSRIREHRQSKRRRRQMWNLSIEKAIFSPREIRTVSVLKRREVYTASLEAHIDRLHSQLDSLGYSVVPEQSLQEYHGLHAKLGKSMISGLYYDVSELRLQLREIYRAIDALKELANPVTDSNKGSTH